MNASALLNPVFLLSVGLLIIAFTLGAFVFPYGARFRETKQHLKGFGVELDLSPLMLFFITGIALVYGGFTSHNRDYESRIADLQSRANSAAALAQAMEKMPRQFMPVLALEGIQEPSEMPNLDDVRVRIYYGLGVVKTVDALRGLGESQLRVVLSDITSDMVVDSLVLTDDRRHRAWVYNTRFAPAVQMYALKKR